MKSNESSTWFSKWRRTSRPVADDPADMGTAFGLDQSLNLLIPETPPKAKPQPMRKPWFARLGWRRKVAL